ncbi:hypothetical protein A9P82_10230 [Arachidicoccus ginsenosidimutans]|nr:hypothetical protein A9P82_10230 [Arachidicoccus sp. BS20]
MEGYTSKEIDLIVGSCEMSVNNWINHFEAAGIAGLQTRSGQGRKRILQEEDISIVRSAIVASPKDYRRKYRQDNELGNVDAFFKTHHCRYKRIRKCSKGKCDLVYYEAKVKQLQLLEHRSTKAK